MKEIMMRWIALLLLSSSIFSATKEYTLLSLVEKYAVESNKTVLVKKLSKKGLLAKVKIDIQENITKEDFKELLLIILSDNGMTIVGDEDFLSVINARNVRYLPSKYYSKNVPETNEYIFYAHKLKYPVGREITRSMRPFMSRYGRIIDVKYGNLIIISDKGKVVKSMQEMFNNFDTKEAFERMKKEVAKKKEKKSRKSGKSKKGKENV